MKAYASKCKRANEELLYSLDLRSFRVGPKEIGGRNDEARRFWGWTTERHWVLGSHGENDAPARR